MFQDSPVFSILSFAIALYLFYMWFGDYRHFAKTGELRKGAFEGATFEEIEIPENITVIEKAAFEGCENLKKVIIPATVTEIGEGAFAGCHEDFYIDAPVGSYAYQYAQENELLPKVIPGDVNGDGKVSALDARWILQYVAGSRAFTARQVEAADLSGDGKVAAIDARKVLQLAAKVG